MGWPTIRRTAMVPSSVLAMTALFKASLANPVIHLPPPILFPALVNLLTTSNGQGPTSKLFLLIPDCIFHMWILPVEELAMPKLPQAVTHTA
jgi:hypothetical protein